VQDVLAGGVHVGAPPDAFNQQGQDWGLPPWRPDRLDATGYAPYREMISALLRRGHGIRIDHVAGLFRLWWIPPGAGPAGGTYVRYDAAAMVGILALEAYRHGAVVVGEDLGTVEPEVTAALADHHLLGCQVLWFARDKGEGAPLRRPADWPPEAAASISTHDLPTAAGFLTGEQVAVRDRLGLLDQPVEVERDRAAADRAEVLALLRAEGLLTAAEPTGTETILAMHALLARTPCRLLLASPYDVLGERRQPNLPGTVDQYPNWRLPLPADLDALLSDPRTAAVARLLRR
jgi:4-alpha-glucanotransferase